MSMGIRLDSETIGSQLIMPQTLVIRIEHAKIRWFLNEVVDCIVGFK